MAGFLLCHALGVECCGGQQQASHALSVPEAELVQPRRAGASAVKSQAGSGGGESPVAGIVLIVPSPALRDVSEAWPLRASQGPYPGPRSFPCGQGSLGEKMILCLSSPVSPRHIRCG